MAPLRLIRATVAALCLLGVTRAEAVTISVPFELVYGMAYQPFENVVSTGLFFQDVLCCGPNPKPHLFGDSLLAPESLGTTVYADAASDGAEFALAADIVSNGVPSWILLGFTSQYLSAEGANYEEDLFASDPLGTGGADLAGLRIDRIGYRFDELLFESPGSDPNGDGGWTDMTIRATLFFEGEPVPEPDVATLVGLGLAGLVALGRRCPN